jgi:hypothetical protein
VPFTFTRDDIVISGEYFKYRVSAEYRRLLKADGLLDALSDETTPIMERAEKIDALLLRQLADTIKSWDVTAGGEPLSPTVENLAKVPDVLLKGLRDHLSELKSENPTNADNSSST